EHTRHRSILNAFVHFISNYLLPQIAKPSILLNTELRFNALASKASTCSRISLFVKRMYKFLMGCASFATIGFETSLSNSSS
ncbi:MAG: hypothetical protein AB8V19_04900, partial [Candidatus Midichloria sp.]